MSSNLTEQSITTPHACAESTEEQGLCEVVHDSPIAQVPEAAVVTCANDPESGLVGEPEQGEWDSDSDSSSESDDSMEEPAGPTSKCSKKVGVAAVVCVGAIVCLVAGIVYKVMDFGTNEESTATDPITADDHMEALKKEIHALVITQSAESPEQKEQVEKIKTKLVEEIQQKFAEVKKQKEEHAGGDGGEEVTEKSFSAEDALTLISDHLKACLSELSKSKETEDEPAGGDQPDDKISPGDKMKAALCGQLLSSVRLKKIDIVTKAELKKINDEKAKKILENVGKGLKSQTESKTEEIKAAEKEAAINFLRELYEHVEKNAKSVNRDKYTLEKNRSLILEHTANNIATAHRYNVNDARKYDTNIRPVEFVDDSTADWGLQKTSSSKKTLVEFFYAQILAPRANERVLRDQVDENKVAVVHNDWALFKKNENDEWNVVIKTQKRGTATNKVEIENSELSVDFEHIVDPKYESDTWEKYTEKLCDFVYPSDVKKVLDMPPVTKEPINWSKYTLMSALRYYMWNPKVKSFAVKLF